MFRTNIDEGIAAFQGSLAIGHVGMEVATPPFPCTPIAPAQVLVTPTIVLATEFPQAGAMMWSRFKPAFYLRSFPLGVVISIEWELKHNDNNHTNVPTYRYTLNIDALGNVTQKFEGWQGTFYAGNQITNAFVANKRFWFAKPTFRNLEFIDGINPSHADILSTWRNEIDTAVWTEAQNFTNPSIETFWRVTNNSSRTVCVITTAWGTAIHTDPDLWFERLGVRNGNGAMLH